MSDHAELIAEQAGVEKMPTGERLKHAKKKRAQQLKRYSQYERQLEKDAVKKTRRSAAPNSSGAKLVGRKSVKKIRFVSDVVLLEAAGRNDVEEVRQLLEQGVSPNSSNEDGLTALHQCCIDDCEEMLRLLIDHGADVNSTDSELWTPLHAAATCGHVHLCKLLIDQGAELLAVNADGNMPYDICEDETALDYIESEMAKRGVTQELIDSTRLSREASMMADLQRLRSVGGDLEYRGRHGETPLHISAANGYLKVTQFLLDAHVRVDALDNDTWQPIHCAACWGQLPVVELLLENGASLDSKTKSGDTPVDVCEDAELRERMLVMRTEIEKCRVSVSRELSRKRSTVIRSASIRRTSMREKKAISWKEAREEAQRLRETSDDVIDHEDDEAALGAKETERSRLLTPDDSSQRAANMKTKPGVEPGTSSLPTLNPATSDSLLHPSINGSAEVLNRPIERRRNSKYRSATRDYNEGNVNYSSTDNHLSVSNGSRPAATPLSNVTNTPQTVNTAGSRENLDASGARINSDEKGDKMNSNQKGSPVNLESTGARAVSKGSLENLEAKGALKNPSDRGSRINSETSHNTTPITGTSTNPGNNGTAHPPDRSAASVPGTLSALKKQRQDQKVVGGVESEGVVFIAGGSDGGRVNNDILNSRSLHNGLPADNSVTIENSHTGNKQSLQKQHEQQQRENNLCCTVL